MEQYRDSQYDDDLTIGTDEYDDSFQTSDIDLFEFGSDEESTISRLKTLVLSIDWEITDEVLEQFQEELIDLKDVWMEEQINMVYLQALGKIGKYIAREKANAHPNAIRLLLSMYYNLERIVLSTDLDEAEKKRTLLEDVRRFEKLKGLIGQQPKAEEPVTVPEQSVPEVIDVKEGKVEELHALKAIVLGIDWEITDTDLIALREEVARLEATYSDSKPKLVFLQGIGTVGTYIRKMKSNAHADAFRLLHSFYDGLENLVSTPEMTLEEETAILKPAVKKFNDFKAIIAATLDKQAVKEASDEDEDEGPDYDGQSPVTPAFSDMPEEGVHGFQEEAEAKSLQAESTVDVDSHIDRFFGEDDDSGPAPASPPPDTTQDAVEQFSDNFFSGEEETAPQVDRATALQGVDVETEADDDSDEEALPVVDGAVAPALAADSGAETSTFADEAPEPTDELELTDAPAEELSEEITGKLDSFFGIEEPESDSTPVEKPTFAIPADVALQGVDVEHPDDIEDEEESSHVFADVVASSELADEDDEEPSVDFTETIEDKAEEQVAAFSDIDEVAESDSEKPEEAVAALADVDLEEDYVEPALGGDVAEDDVGEKFDELFAALPDEDEVASEPIESDPVVEDEVDAFFALDESAEELAPGESELAGEDDLFDQEILGVREEEPVDFEIEPTDGVEVEVESEELQGEESEGYAEFKEAESQMDGASGDTFVELSGCIESVALELNDDIINGLFSEIEHLQETFADSPLQKSFLQLISTVARHIDQYRYEASDGAIEMLGGLMTDLTEASGLTETGPAQQMLFTSMSRVLEWQQEQLARRSGSPVDADQQIDVEPLIEDSSEITESIEETEQSVESIEAGGQVEDVTDRRITDLVRSEIDILRETLKKEIADLKKTLHGKQ